MNIKITSGPSAINPADAAETAEAAATTEAVESAEGTSAAVSADAVGAMTEQLASGQISREEAVEQLLAQVMESGIVDAAPAELREELGDVLRTLLETDPALGDLVSRLSDE